MSILEPKIIWSEVLKQLSKSMSPSSFSTWVKPLSLQEIKPIGPDRAIAKLVASSPYVAQQAEMRVYAQLKELIDQETKLLCDLAFETSSGQIDTTPLEPETANQNHKSSFKAQNSDNSLPQQPQSLSSFFNQEKSKPNSQAGKSQPQSLFTQSQIVMPTVDRYKLATQKAHLREDYTFDSFAVSSSNEMAYAAASAVAASPGQVYNPLFLWGGVGVGKTHLMQSIGNAVLKANPDSPLSYSTGEEFLNEIISAIRTKKTLEFKERYRHLKVLLIDDIQFIAGKDTAQEEFFHTFNAITKSGGQIIMTSDRPPYEISPLEDRLRSRFEGGLTIDIQQPTFELRSAILLIKSSKMGLELPLQLAQIVASEVESTRKLEGVIYKIHSAHRFQNKPLDETLIRQILGSESKPVIARKKLKPSAILRAVTSHFHVSASTLRGPSRKKDYVTARHIAMYLLKSELNVPFAEIGHSFGGRDHTSVMHAVSKIEDLVQESQIISQHVSAIRASLSNI